MKSEKYADSYNDQRNEMRRPHYNTYYQPVGKPPKKKTNKIILKILFVIIIVFVLFVGLMYFLSSRANVDDLKSIENKNSFVPADNMPNYVKGAFISMEDERFINIMVLI